MALAIPWESYVLSSFRALPPKEPSRSDVDCSYLKLLHCLFPMVTYSVVPSWKPDAYLAPYFRMDIWYNFKPVILLEFKESGDLQYSSKRQEGIQQVQDRLRNLVHQVNRYMLPQYSESVPVQIQDERDMSHLVRCS